MKTILLTGVTGQVGQELQDTLLLVGKVIALKRDQLDLTNPESIRLAIAKIQPDIIINPAAYTAVDKAESEPEIAYAINGIAPSIMAKEAEKINATLIHVSTDYIFDGRKNSPYLEDDTPNPIGIYGKSKFQGEQGIRENSSQHIIFRTAWVYGSRGYGNFVKTMLRLGKEREEIRVVADQIGSPTWSKDIALAITNLLQLPTFPLPGTYHFTSSGVASWYDFAVAIFELAKELGFPLRVKRVIPINTSEYPTPAQRPAYSVLSTRKLETVLGDFPPHWRSSLKQMLQELASNL